MQAEIGETLLLVEEAKNGDTDALNRLFERFAPYVRRVVQIYLGGLPNRREDVDDCVQETLLRALKGLKRFGSRPENNFRGWLSCCARCAVLDLHKKIDRLRPEGRVVKPFTEWGSDYIRSSIFSGKEPTPSALAMGAELEQKMVEALISMEARHRKIIVYRQLCEMSYEEIAAKLGLRDRSNARVQCHRALKKLRAMLEN